MCSEKESEKPVTPVTKSTHSIPFPFTLKIYPVHFVLFVNVIRWIFLFCLSFFENVHIIAEERYILFFQAGILGHMHIKVKPALMTHFLIRLPVFKLSSR